jgi:hypothetical protein
MNDTDQISDSQSGPRATGGGEEAEVEDGFQAADRRNGEPAALREDAAPTGTQLEHEHLERHPHGHEMPSDIEVQAERQEEGMEAEEQHV